MNSTATRIYALVLLPVVMAVAAFAYVKRQETVPTVRIGERSFSVEIASTDEARRKGLSERDDLRRGHGMLFPFDTPGRQGFWMKGMRFPIDIAWIRDGRIVHIERKVPYDFEGIVFPPTEADTVLETEAGALSDARVGDEVISVNVP